MHPMYQRGIATLALCGGTGCVYGPFYDDTIDSTTTSVTFNLYALKPGAVMTAECANHYSPFTEFGSKVSSSTPVTLAGESIYPARLDRVIPAACWDFGFDKPVTYLRFFQKKDGQTYTVQTFTHQGRDCVADHVNGGEGWITAGWACRDKDEQQVRLFANH
jgi:hypothetical protein